MTQWSNEPEPQRDDLDDLDDNVEVQRDVPAPDDVVDPDLDPGAQPYVEDEPDPEAPLTGPSSS